MNSSCGLVIYEHSSLVAWTSRSWQFFWEIHALGPSSSKGQGEDEVETFEDFFP